MKICIFEYEKLSLIILPTVFSCTLLEMLKLLFPPHLSHFIFFTFIAPHLEILIQNSRSSTGSKT